MSDRPSDQPETEPRGLGCNAVVMRKIDAMMLRAAIKEIIVLHQHLIDAKGWIQTSNGIAMMLEDHLKESGL